MQQPAASAVYLPSGWWHATVNVGDAVGAALQERRDRAWNEARKWHAWWADLQDIIETARNEEAAITLIESSISAGTWDASTWWDRAGTSLSR